MSNGGYFARVDGGIKAERKFPVMIVHGYKDPIFPVAFARENRDKYNKEGHAVQYVELPCVGHEWGIKVVINDTMWKFFDENPRPKK